MPDSTSLDLLRLLLTNENEDKNYYIAQSNALLDEKEKFIKEIIVLRKNSEFKSLPREWAQYIDLSPRQLVSIASFFRTR